MAATMSSRGCVHSELRKRDPRGEIAEGIGLRFSLRPPASQAPHCKQDVLPTYTWLSCEGLRHLPRTQATGSLERGHWPL